VQTSERSFADVNFESHPTGHLPTLLVCFTHFDVCFMLWVLIGALGPFVFEGTGLDAGLKGLVVGVPILIGSLLRIPLGLLSDRLGGRRVGLALLLVLTAPLSLAWLAPGTLTVMLLTGLMLGSAGASFAIVLPLASRWYPKERQGLVMGIAAAGNSGTVLANVFAPRLAASLGWHNVFGLALVPLMTVTLLFWLFARDAPTRVATTREAYRAAVTHRDTWRFCLFYAVTFGGFVGLSSFLPVFLRDQFGVSPVTAGSLTALAAFSGSLARPIGGYLADSVGGAAVLQTVLFTIAVAYASIAALPALALSVPLVVIAMTALGLGNGVVFQLVPLRFQREVGSVTGIVGAVGGIGGFVLPTWLGSVKQISGSYGTAFLALAVFALAAAFFLRALQNPARRGSRYAGNLAAVD
jgi:NNP family nitrate/nitrite transporter-like MFS transporter